MQYFLLVSLCDERAYRCDLALEMLVQADADKEGCTCRTSHHLKPLPAGLFTKLPPLAAHDQSMCQQHHFSNVPRRALLLK